MFSISLYEIYPMRALFVLLITAMVAASSCHHPVPTPNGVVPTSDHITAVGKLQKQGFTIYMYGTHVLEVSPTISYVLKSSMYDLDAYLGSKVKITAVNTHYQAEMGPELYDVIAIAPEP